MQPTKFLRRITPAIAVVAVVAAGPSTAAHAWTETVLHSFAGGSDGAYPLGNLIADQSGNLYGTTEFGGGACKKSRGCGTVFKLAPDGTETVLYAFHRRADGGWPIGGLVQDSQGNLFGTTSAGGNSGNGHWGTVFEVTQNGVETVLHAFQSGSDGDTPLAGLVSDQAGNLYGTTSESGTCSDCGTVFKVTPAGVYTMLYSFMGGSDGADSQSPLIFDAAGNLYGTAGNGGAGCPDGCGTVFELTPDGTETVLYAFKGGRDGLNPTGALIFDAAGNLYGTTVGGGNANGGCCGTAFEIAAGGTETVLSRFNRTGGPRNPDGGVVMDEQGNLFGTTHYGGSANCGTVFEIVPGHPAKAVYSFTCGSDGAYPVAGLLRDASGHLYGTTEGGGSSKNGTVFSLHN